MHLNTVQLVITMLWEYWASAQYYQVLKLDDSLLPKLL